MHFPSKLREPSKLEGQLPPLPPVPTPMAFAGSSPEQRRGLVLESETWVFETESCDMELSLNCDGKRSKASGTKRTIG